MLEKHLIKCRILVMILVALVFMQLYVSSPSLAAENSQIIVNQVAVSNASFKRPANIKLIDSQTSRSDSLYRYPFKQHLS